MNGTPTQRLNLATHSLLFWGSVFLWGRVGHWAMEVDWGHLAYLNPLQFTNVSKRKCSPLLSPKRDKSAIEADRQEMTTRIGY